MLRFRNLCPLILLLLFAGCSGNVGLKGTVTFLDDDSPLTVGTVALLKDGKIARGDIKPDGTYVVGFESERDGLPPGTYQIYILGFIPLIPPPHFPMSRFAHFCQNGCPAPEFSGQPTTYLRTFVPISQVRLQSGQT